jgi:hypothetical protein
MIMPADLPELEHLKDILRKFSSSTGLHVNYHKTSLIHVIVDENHAHFFIQLPWMQN